MGGGSVSRQCPTRPPSLASEHAREPATCLGSVAALGSDRPSVCGPRAQRSTQAAGRPLAHAREAAGIPYLPTVWATRMRTRRL